MRNALRIGNETDLAMVWSAVCAAHIFGERDEFNRFFGEAPWRVQVTDAGEAAVLERWREHLNVLSVRGLWCAERRVAALMSSLDAVSSRQGFADILSPIVPESHAEPYRDAGMHVCQRVITMRLDRLQHQEPVPSSLPEGVTLRLGCPDDLEALVAIDITAFDAFWRGDAPTISRYLSLGRVMVAEAAGQLIGYTLATVEREEGMLGRLTVVPRHRGRGVGTWLLNDAVEYLVRAGAFAVSLCTQEDNAMSRSLYGRAGFREVGETSVLLAYGRTPETQAI
ncbi:MAG: GNAT family N-acetyltransferase [Coriobacteriia bacterium]|nr:GNAT family N-acetyltransferase [Coriobacteriia bacterium]